MAKGTYRKSTSGSKVKYDNDPSNDKSDGYNSGRRYGDRKLKSILGWLIPLLLLLLALMFAAGFYLGKVHEQHNRPHTTVPSDPPKQTVNEVPDAPKPPSLPESGGME